MSLFGDEDIIYDDDDRFDDDFDSSVTAQETKLCAPKSMTFCLGHKAQERQFIDFIENNNMPHAMVFSGPEGVGKTTMAFRLTRFLFKRGVDDGNQGGLFCEALPTDKITSLDVPSDDPVSSRITSGGHADLLHLERYFDESKGKRDRNLKVDVLRKIEPFLRKTSSEGGWRIVIVEDADSMNRNAQNAILKILEEPPKNVLIILIAHQPGLLIPTIRSRSRVMPFSTLSAENMSELLSINGTHLTDQDTNLLCALSNGSFGHALRYLEEGGLELFPQVIEHLETFPQWNWGKIHALSSTLSAVAQDKEYQMFCIILQWVFRQILFFKARGEAELPDYLNVPILNKIMSEYALESLIAICDNLKMHFERIEFANLDRRDAIRTAFLVINESL